MYENRKRKNTTTTPITITTASHPLSKNMQPPTTAAASTKKTLKLTPSRLKDLLLILSFLTIIYLLFSSPRPQLSLTPRAAPSTSFLTTRRHIVFSIASSSTSFIHRQHYIRLWYNPTTMRAFAFLDREAVDPTGNNTRSIMDPTLPRVIISKDTSSFPYTFKGGLKSAIRVARVVKEVVELNEPDVHWFVFGDDDTVFFVENLVTVLSKYDHNGWFYVGSNSESYDQNVKNSFEMGFGGGGFAISYSLAKVLARVLDSCLVRYAHLYGSDARIFSCLAELGVGLSHEPGFHQVDMRGDLFGMLSAHPSSPLVSLHHLDAVNSIFPNMSKTQALEHLFNGVNVDPARVLQQTVCYDPVHSLTVSVAWGYSVQVFEGNEFLPDLLIPQRTFMPWRRGGNAEFTRFMFNIREYPKDPCKRPLVFFMESVTSGKNGIWSNYIRHDVADCNRGYAMKNLELVRVLSHKLEPDIEQMKFPRRQCCDAFCLI
ncbi:FRINGE-RELATED [Salix purpurea]|uniref:FRINGE-RELATED n=1 Tax=Salix purpurea TaxID=77065 RepID=A0A9Q0UQR8_SALPP|nr:FRINGE-RELATED [Salix purpurea]